VNASASALFIAVFLACAVEAVEAVTIVLAAGTARDWRSAGTGTVSALAVVVFIVLTFGANAKNVGLASIAAGCATVLVAGVGFAVRAPLARVPENTMKFVVGIMLTSFGVFWGGEGAGASWPGSDAALLVIIPAVALFGLGLIWFMRRSPGGTKTGSAGGASADLAAEGVR